MADEALRKAVARVVEEHRKSGEPLSPSGGMGRWSVCLPISFRGMRRRLRANLARQEMRGQGGHMAHTERNTSVER